MAGRSLFPLISLILVAGALALMFFIMLAGATDHNPLIKFYFLEADTSGIPGAAPLSRWTFWNLCSVDTAGNNDCAGVHPAFPLDPPSGRNFGTSQGVPSGFLGTRQYFYMTRFMFALELIAMFFGACAFFTGILALCTRLGSYLSGLLASFALLFQSAAASLMTVAYVKGRNNFTSNGQAAHLGRYAFGFEWGAWAAFFIATILFCIGGGVRKDEAAPSYSSSKQGFFGPTRTKSTKSNKSNRSRGSFLDGPRTSKEFQ